MDPRAQDVVRCELCDTTTAEMHCDTCLINVCKACVGEHMFDESIDHKIVKFNSRKTTILYPFCLEHSKKRCDMYCKVCDFTVCSLCITSDAHIGHKIMSLLKKCEIIKKDIQKDNEDLRSNVTPLYQKLLYDVEMKIKEVEEKYEETSNLLQTQSDDWHQQITNIVEQFRAEIAKPKETVINTFKVQKSEIEETLSKIIFVLKFNEEIQESSELIKVIVYKSQNTLFRTPTDVDIPLQMPLFSPKNINLESLKQQFGSLAYSESSNVSPTPGANEKEQLLLNKPIEIAVIDTGFSRLQSIACTNTYQIWAIGVGALKLFETIECKEVKRIHNYKRSFSDSSKYLAVNQDGELIYSCLDTRTVNILKGERWETLIRLENWLPRGICITSTGDMLITMTRKKQSKVVRYAGTIPKQTIQFGYKGKNTIPFSEKPFLYVTENNNRDICVSRGEVVVFKETGELRFRYNGRYPPPNWNEDFSSSGIATDRYCHILIADTGSKCIHIIDQNGKFLQDIDCGNRKPSGLCIDSFGFLFVDDKKSRCGEIAKYKYQKISEASIAKCKNQEIDEASIEKGKYKENHEASIEKDNNQENDKASIAKGKCKENYETSIAKGKNQEIEEASIAIGKYQEVDEASIAKSNYQEVDEASIVIGKYQDVYKASIATGKYHEVDEASIAKGKYQEVDEASIATWKYQEVHEASIAKGKSKEIDDTSVAKGKTQEIVEANIAKGENQEIEEASIAIGKYQEVDEASIVIGKSQDVYKASIAIGKYHEVDEASITKGKYKEIDDTSVAKGKTQEIVEASIAKGKNQEIVEASIAKGKCKEINKARDTGSEVPSFFSKDWYTYIF